MNHTLAKVQKIGIVNSPEFFELFALRIFSTCLFQLAPGASKVKTRELCNYIENTVNRYFPHYWRNSKARLTVKADIQSESSSKGTDDFNENPTSSPFRLVNQQ